MTDPLQPEASRERVLLLLPTAKDASLTAGILARNGITAHACAAPGDLATDLAAGAGAVLISEEALSVPGTRGVLAQAVDAQPPWSDLPVLVLTRQGADSHEVRDALQMLGNVTLLERPLRVSALMSTVRTALRARARQYQLQHYLQDLEAARAAQTIAAERKDEFVAMLAHELRNPLAPLRNALSVLSIDDSDPKRREMLRAMMTRQIDHMVRLVDDLMDASRMSRGRVDLRRQRIDLCDALRGAIEIGRPAVTAARSTMDIVLPDEPLAVVGDTARLIQVFGNLLNNAAKYGRPGGHIVLEARTDGAEAIVTVRDDGIGIEPELLPHVFDLFTQGRRDPERMQEGLGIGLSLVRDLVKMHGGTVTAHSEGRGHGAVFEVRLPLATATRSASEPPEATTAVAATPASLRVLIVDDNVDAALSLSLVLDTLGMQHRESFSGPEALAVADDFLPQVVLLDIGMPGMDGYEVARRLRRNPRHADTMLVAVSGWNQEPDRRHARAAGFDHHFPKPVDIAALTALLAGSHREAPAQIQ